EAEGKWPQFGSAVVRERNLKPPKKGTKPPKNPWPLELWPAAPEDLSAPVRVFLEKKLYPLLDLNDRLQIDKAHGHWPQFPDAIQKRAVRPTRQAPWHTFPGRREAWTAFRLPPRAARASLPQPPWEVLRDFALRELDPGDRDGLLRNPGRASRQRLTEM